MSLPGRQPIIRDSWLARWDARWKLSALVVSALVVATLRQPRFIALALVLAILLALSARITIRSLATRLGLLLLAVAPLLFFLPLMQQDQERGWNLGPVFLSEAGLEGAAAIAGRMMTIGVLGLVLTRTAPLSTTFAAANALYCPGVLAQIADLALRYTYSLAGEARRMLVSLRTRGFRARTNWHTYQTMGHSVGALLVRGADQAERVAIAMQARGFDGQYRPVTEFRTKFRDVLSFLVVVVISMAVLLIDRFV